MVPSFFTMSPCRLLLGRPLDLFPLLKLPLCAALGPSVVFQTRHVPSPFPFMFYSAFYDVSYIRYFSDL